MESPDNKSAKILAWVLSLDGVHTNGGRYCKTCQKVHRANYSARQKEGVSNG